MENIGKIEFDKKQDERLSYLEISILNIEREIVGLRSAIDNLINELKSKRIDETKDFIKKTIQLYS